MSDINTTENYCKNCNHTFTKHYCNGCGQKSAHRITMPHLAHEVLHVTLHADKGIFPFLKRIVLSPGKMAKEYIDGKRKTFNPLQFLVLSVAFVILLMSLTHFYTKVELWYAANLPVNPPAMQQKLKGFNTFIQKNGNIIIFLLMPIFALFGSLLFAKKKNNYAEHLMLCIYALSLSNVLTAVMLITYFFIGLGVMPIIISTLLCTLISFLLVYKQFYQIGWFNALWKSLIIYVLTMIVYLVASMVITIFILILT